MVRLFGPGLVGFLVFALWVYCVLDVIATDAVLIRNLPKVTWLVIVLIFGPLGSIAWLAVGRPQFAGWRPGDTTPRRPPRRYTGPEDRPDFDKQ
jgi:hypothetical protein